MTDTSEAERVTTPPIQVSNDVLPTALAAALRYAIALICSWLVSSGKVEAGSVEQIGAVLLGIATIGYGLWKTYTNKAKLVVTADAAPNSVAVVK